MEVVVVLFKLPTQNVSGETLESHGNLRTTDFRVTFDVWTSSTRSRIANNRLVEIKWRHMMQQQIFIQH